LSGRVHDPVAGVPRLVDWFVPLTKPDVRTLALAATLAVAAIALRLPASAARTGLIVLAALVTAAVVTAATMRSPWGAVTLDILRYAPLALVWASAPLALREVSPEAPRLLWWYGACATLALSPSADLPHALLLLPAVVPLLGLLLQRAWSAAGPGLVTKACVVVLAAGPLLLPVRRALVARSGAIAARPDQAPGFARATRIWDGSPHHHAAFWPGAAAPPTPRSAARGSAAREREASRGVHSCSEWGGPPAPSREAPHAGRGPARAWPAAGGQAGG